MTYHFRRAVAFVALLLVHFVPLIAIGTVVFFGTVPPEVHPETAGKVSEGKCLLFVVLSFLVGMACYRNIQRFDRSIEK